MSVTPDEIEKAQTLLLAIDESSELPALAKLDLVRRGINFANTGWPKGLPGAREIKIDGESHYVDTGTIHTDFRKDFTALLADELSGPAVSRLIKQARHVAVRTYQMERGKLVSKERNFVKDLPQFLAYLLLLVSSDPTLKGDAKQCRLLGCGRFFLKSDLVKDPSAQGRKPDRYCSPEHRIAAGSIGGAARTRKYREKLKRQSGARTASKHK